MAVNQYISVKICGNPDSNSGFAPLLLSNNASFTVEDQFYVGFDSCSYFFSYKVESTQTIYKLIKNNVRSYGAARAGSLVIAFSVPKGYDIDNGFSPYDVLIQLKDEFLKLCMTCKDTVRETYEFKPGRIDQHILDEKIKLFSISPSILPHRVMKPDGNIGYIVRPEDEIEKIFRDLRYPDFQNYKEIILADTLSGTNNYVSITNIQIPRPRVYTLVIDGVIQTRQYSDKSETISIINEKINNPYYDLKTKEFTLNELLEGNYIEGVSLDNSEEQIKIDTTKILIPKTKKLIVKIIPQEFEKEIWSLQGLIIEGPSGNIQLDNNYSFTLSGEQISWIHQKQIKVHLKPNDRYELVDFSINDNCVQVNVKKKIKIETSDQSSNIQKKYILPSKSGCYSPVLDVKFSFSKDLFDNLSNRRDILISTIRYDEHLEKRLSTTKVVFKKVNHNLYEGHLFISKEYQMWDCYIYIENKKSEYYSISQINFSKDEFDISDKDIESTKKSFISRYSKLMIIIFTLCLMFIAGCIVGYLIYEPINRKVPKNESINTEKYQTSNIQYSTDTEYKNESDELKNKVYSFLNNAKERLESENLSFDEIEEFYNISGTLDNRLLKEIDEERFNGKICNQIKDYYTTKDILLSADKQAIIDLISEIEKGNLHIYKKHSKPINLLKNSDTYNQYMSNLSNMKTFVDIMRYEIKTKYKCEHCNKEFNSENQLVKHKNSNKHWHCKYCKKAYATEKELNDHISFTHKEN